MRLLISAAAIFLLAFVFQWILPWWSAVIAGFIGAFFVSQKNGIKSFFSGFAALAILWGGSAFLINSANDGILATQLADLFRQSGPGSLILVTALIGGFLGGFGACTGDLGKQLLRGDS